MNSVTNCPICLDNFQGKVKASPDNCEHVFCLQCIEKWSKMGSYCPVDRKRFRKILNLDSDSVIQVKSRKRKRKRPVYDFSTNCEVCSGSTNADVLLLCDCCDLGYHMFCLKPKLKEVPAGLWFCPTCISVEERLKRKNGITKEVEAELGGFDSSSIKEKVNDEKKSTTKGKKLDTPATTVKNPGALQTCYDIISEFEDMKVMKSNSKEATSSNHPDLAINKLDKIYKTFDNTVNKKLSVEHSKHLKTYSVTNASRKSKRISDLDSKKSISETVSVNPNNTSLDRGNTSRDIDFPSSEAYNILPDKPVENSLIKNRRLKLPIKTFDVPVLEKRVTRQSIDKITVPEKNAQESIKKSLRRKHKKLHSDVVASYSEDSVASCSRLRSSKGTSKNLIQFSVFDKIEGIDTSQEICSEISAVEVPNMCLQQCSVCYNQFFAESESQCKLCKLKYFNTKESKRFSYFVKKFKKGLSNKKYEHVNWNKMKYDYRALGTQEKVNNNAYVLERRKRSLIRTLKKIHDSKCIINAN